MNLSARANKIKESGTVRFTSILEKLKKEGENVISFAVGEPDLPTPKSILEATKKALDNQKTKYAAVSGIIELKEKIIEKSVQEGYSYKKENLMISNGSKQSLYNVFQALCNPGDEVIIPKPYWVSYEEQIKLSDGKPILVDTSKHQLDIENIKDAISKKTKAIIINTPNNPSGAVFKEKDIRAVSELAIDHDFHVIYDEAYESLIFDGLRHVHLASLSDGISEKTITVKTFSKTYSMTGFRVGYVLAKPELIKAMNNIQSNTTGNVCTFAQYGAIAALDLGEKELEKRKEEYESRRNIAYNLTKELFECIKPQGAFYLFPDVTNALNGMKSEEFSNYLLEKARVALVPGSSFGVENHMRVSYACSKADIKEGFERIKEAIA